MGDAQETVWNGLAVDLGASGGRVLLGRYDGEQLMMEEVHRFANEPVRVRDTLYWDILRLFHEIKQGLRKVVTGGTANRDITSLGIDSWAVDYGLLDSNGNLLGHPVHYRDRRTNGVMEKVFNHVPRDQIFFETGIQFLPFNTIYQLASVTHAYREQLEQADTFLMIPDLLHYFLTGAKVAEFTNATTTQLFNPIKGAWSQDLIGQIDVPPRIFPSVVQPGTSLGRLSPSVSEEVGGLDLDVTAVATHDTGSAVVAVPARSSQFAYLSCGTWSLLGTEVREPVLTDRALELNFTNEGGVGGTYRLLKNVMGLWLLQEIKREWERQGRTVTWEAIADMTAKAGPSTAFIDPDDSTFLPPGDMTSRVGTFCRNTGQPVPDSDGAIVRCVTESLALKYRWVLDRLEELTDSRLDVLHMVGGGIQNTLLCQWTANALGRPVLTGPVEASGLGNLIVQLMASGEVSSLSQGRELVAHSSSMKDYEPMDTMVWEEAYVQFNQIIKTKEEGIL